MTTPSVALRRKVPWAGTTTPAIVAVHAEESAFLWLLRDKAVYAPHYRLNDLEGLDERIEGNLQGVRLAGPAGLAICSEVLERTDAGEAFTFCASAVAAGDQSAVQVVFDTALPDPELRRGVVSALAWLPWQTAQHQIRALLESEEPRLKSAAIAALALRRIDPGGALRAALEGEDEIVRIAAIRAIGLLGRTDLLGHVKMAAADASHSIRNAAAWSGSVLCDGACTNQLCQLATQDDTPWRDELLRIAFRRFGNEGASRLRELARQSPRPRDVVVSAGALGDPAVVPWLIEKMSQPGLARVAGEAFSEITGAHFEVDQLWREPPSPPQAEVDPALEEEVIDDLDEESVPAKLDSDTDLPADRELYWPDVDKVTRWWELNKSRFRNGVRHLAGRTLTTDALRDILQNGYQRHRAAAALEFVACQTDQALPEVRAPAYRKRAG